MGSTDSLPPMQYRNLGRSGLKVSVISLGGWVTYGGQVGDQIAFDCMKAAFDAGINFFDCAEAYSAGKSEVVMGQAIKKYGWKRNDLVISTKIYWGGAFGDNPVNNKGLSRKHVIEGTNAALERLQLDYVDLLYCHRPDRETPIEETVRAMNYLINTGKVFYWGTSEWNTEEIAIAHQIADRLGLIGPLMDNPLKAGILTGKYNDGIPPDSRMGSAQDAFSKNKAKQMAEKDEAFLKEIEQVKSLMPVAKKLDTDMATLALAWVISNPHVSSAITGASKIEQVTAAVKSLDLVPKLTAEIKKEIDDILGNKPAPLTSRF